MIKSHCKICKQLITRTRIWREGRTTLFLDDNHRQWVGKTCPSCWAAISLEKQKAKRIHYTKSCSTCKKDFSTTYSNRVYCSKRCHQLFINEQCNLKYIPAPIVNYKKICPECNTHFETTNNRKIRCSKKCITKYRYRKQPKREHIIKSRSCIYCSVEFIPMTPYSKRCSIECKPKKIPPKLKEIHCDFCGDVFLSIRTRRFCNKRCSRKNHRKTYKPRRTPTAKSRIYRKIAKKRRELKLRQACPKWIKNKSLIEVEKMRPSMQHDLDHIIPLNHPDVCGLHVPWNLRWLPKEENNFKNNKFDGTWENESWRCELPKKILPLT